MQEYKVKWAMASKDKEMNMKHAGNILNILSVGIINL